MSGTYNKTVYLCKKLPNSLPKWLYYCAFPLVMKKSSCYFSSSAFGIVFLGSDQCNTCYLTGNLICSSLTKNEVEHLFICYCISSRCIKLCIYMSGVCWDVHFLIWLFSYCWLLRILFICWYKSFGRCILQIFSSCLWLFFLLLTIAFTMQKF